MAGDLLILLGSFAVLALAADRFVVSASRVATLIGASPLFIGVVLIGIGTSLPDWLVSAFAAADGQDGLAIGNLVGSNTVNIGLALGIAALITPIAVSAAVLRKEAVVSILCVAGASAALIGGISRIEGIVLLVALPIVLLLLRPSHPPPPQGPREGRLPVELVISLLTLAAIVAASRLLVDAAGNVARDLGVSEAFIGLTLVALGTSLPEIVVAIQAARRRETDLIVGNVLGSNIVNSLGLAGTAALVVPEAPLHAPELAAPAALMLGFAVVAGVLLATGRRLVRWEAALLVTVYVVTLPLFFS